LTAILVGISSSAIALAVKLFGHPHETILVVYLIALSSVFFTFSGLTNSAFQAFVKNGASINRDDLGKRNLALRGHNCNSLSG
jgi:O-antigen/teichoic acid export membrane protein